MDEGREQGLNEENKGKGNKMVGHRGEEEKVNGLENSVCK